MIQSYKYYFLYVIFTSNLIAKCFQLSETNGKPRIPVSRGECHHSFNLILGTDADSDDRCNKTVDIYQRVSSPPVTDSNRGKPLHCTYRIRIRPPRDDWIVFVRLIRMKVGELSADREKCVGGYVQIVDGYRETNQSNKDNSGEYCWRPVCQWNWKLLFMSFKSIEFLATKYMIMICK
jgi:hypothetical protein